MSESVSAPAPAPGSSDAPSAPPPASQPGISVSEAARLLSQQRRRDGPRDGNAAPQSVPQPANGQAAAEPAAKTQEAPQRALAPATGDPSLDSMAKALGLEQPPATPAESTPPASAEIEVDGRRLTAEEVRRALAHQQDYTRKTQQLAEQMRQVQEQHQALATVLPYLQPEIARLQQQIQAVPRPDPALIETNGQEYLRQLAAWQHSLDEQGRLGQLQAIQQQAADRVFAQQVERSNEELSKQLPGWSDPQQRSKWQADIINWATEHGFQRAELHRLADHRQLTTMMKAMLWDRMAAGAKTSAPIQQVPARGTPPPPAPAQRVSDAEQAFDQRPNIRNAAMLLSARRAGSR